MVAEVRPERGIFDKKSVSFASVRIAAFRVKEKHEVGCGFLERLEDRGEVEADAGDRVAVLAKCVVAGGLNLTHELGGIAALACDVTRAPLDCHGTGVAQERQ